MQHLMMTTEEWFKEWEGNRRLTRKVIETFPEKELFEFSIGGMRTFAQLVGELIQLAVEGTQQLATGEIFPFTIEHRQYGTTKAELLASWDKAAEQIRANWAAITPEKFREPFKMYEMYDFLAWEDMKYIYENEIHHRGQGYVYLRALDIEPPVFYDRS